MEGIEIAGGFDGAVNGLDAGADFHAVLVIHRDDHGVALDERAGFPLGQGADSHGALAAQQHVERAENCVKRTEHEQPIQDHEDRQQRIVGFLIAHPPE